MAKNDELKRKLKAASKRRARRPEPLISPSATIATDLTASNQLDVAGLCVDQILEPNRRRTCNDLEVISALTCCVREANPSNEAAASLHQRLIEIADRDDVSSSQFREAVRSLLTTATQHQDAKDDTAFMRFLSILAS